MTSISQDNKSLLDDPNVSFIQRVLAVYAESREAKPAYKAYMASTMNIYRKLLPDSIELLENLQKLNRKLTSEEERLLRSALQVKGIPLHNNDFIKYLVSNPKEIGSGIMSLIVDSNLNPVYFRENGLEGSIDDIPVLAALKTKKHLNVNQAELQLRNTVESLGENGFVTADIIGLASSKQVAVSDLKKAKVYVHFETTPEEYATPFGKFILNPGYTYVEIPGDPYQYQPVKLPQASPDFLIKLVDAFNNGILPTGLPSEIYESAEAFKSYLENLFYFNADTQGLILGSTQNNKLVFKKKNKNGKYQAITGSEEVQLGLIRGAFANLRYMVSKQSLTTNQPSTLLYEQNGIRLKSFPNYEALVLSPEFGAQVIMRGNSRFALSSELTIESTISNAEKGFEDVLPEVPLVSDIPSTAIVETEAVEIPEEQLEQVEKQLNLFVDQPQLTPEEAEEAAQLPSRRIQDANERREAIQRAQAEMYQEYQVDLEAFRTGSFLNDLQAAIDSLFGGAFITSKQSFIRFGDKNSLDGVYGDKIKKTYFPKRSTPATSILGLDQIAQLIEDRIGREVTPSELVDFMTTYPGGIGTVNSRNIETVYGRFNPKKNPKYDGIRGIIAKEERAASKEFSQDEFPTDTSDFRDPWDEPPPANIPNPFEDDFFRSLELENDITEAQNKAAEEWVNSHPIFKNTKFIFDKTLRHPLAYATWSKAAITLFADANYAEAYHEAWHEFSQMYLTPAQREALYAEARKIYGELPLVELEEKLAESFRQFALSNGTEMPSEIAKYESTKNIFQKIWDFLTGFFTDKLTVDKYFSQLYKGNISSYTRNEDAGYFKTLYSAKLVVKHPDNTDKVFSFRESQQILTQMDSLFVDVA